MIGIDLSENNGYVDFQKVKESGIDFVILRVGWIGNKENHTLDKYFEDYYKRSKEVGLQVGFYVYSYCKSISAIKSGTNWVLQQIKNKTNEMPIFIDMEDSTISYLGKTELTNHAKTFCSIIESNGKKAGVYANLNWFTSYLNVNELIQYKIWLAQYTTKETHSANFKVDLWQYTSSARVNGVSGNVDMNKCLNCEKSNITQENINKEGDFEMKIYQNGSTKEDVFQDCNCTKRIGYLNPRETAECYGIVNNKAVVVYKIDNQNNKKVGFVKWLGGVK